MLPSESLFCLWVVFKCSVLGFSGNTSVESITKRSAAQSMSCAGATRRQPMSDIVALQQTLYHSRNPTRRWLHTSRRDAVLSAIKQAPLDRFRRAMEVGPGSGIYLPALCERFEAVVAMD